MSLLRKFTDFLLHNRLQAIAAAFVLAYLPVIGGVSILIAGLVTLRKGAKEGSYVLVAATLPYILNYYVAGGETTNIVLIAMGIVVTSNILVWFFAILLKKYENWSLILEHSFLLGLVGIGLFHLIYPDIQAWWRVELTSYFSKSVTLVSNLPGNEKQITQIPSQMAAVIKDYATGLIFMSVVFNAFLQLLIARWWQAVVFNPGGLRQELYKIQLSYVTAILFIIIVATGYMKNITMMDMEPVVFAVFSLAGFSLLHCILAQQKTGWLLLGLIYVVSILTFPFSLMIVSLLALFDVWIDFRRRMVKQ